MDKVIGQDKRDQRIDIIVFGILFAIATAVTLLLFHWQTLGSPETGYHSDMKAYILEMQGLNTKYSFPYPILFKLGAFFHLFTTPEFAIALATCFLNGLAMVFLKLSFHRMLKEELAAAMPKHSYMAGILISLVTISLFFISMLFPPTGIYLPGIRFNYLGVFTANPFHNATYMAARPFAILAFFQFAKLLDVYEKGAQGLWKDYLAFTLSLLLATMAKPSFTIVLVGAAGLLMLYRMLRSKFKNFVATLQLGFCFLPTFGDLLYQFKGVFVPEEGVEGGIGFCLGDVWKLYTDNLPLALCLAIGCPIVVLLFNYQELKKNTLYRFSWQIYMMGFAMAFLLYEKGFRKPDFNFSWGYMYGIFFTFVGALFVLLKETARKKWHWTILLQWAAYGMHLLCGLYYFYRIFRGGFYY